ncbi:MAG: hypothetical protein ACTSRG_21265 [Candidatus Helarchaeota archaeon]
MKHLEGKQKKLKVYNFDSIQEDVLRRNLGKIVLNLQNKNRKIVIFQNQLSICSEKEILEDIKAEFGRLNLNIKNIDSNEILISLEEANENSLTKSLFIRFIGELIALTLRHRDERILVYDEYGKNVYHATLYDTHKKFNIISLYKGFKFKPIIYNKNCAILIDPRCKYFTEYDLSAYYHDMIEDFEFFRGIEQLCPISDCEFNLRPFTICNYGNPKNRGYTSDLILEQTKPSDCDPNLIEYFKNPEKCPTSELGKLIEKRDQPPVVKKFFNYSTTAYNYPLELLRIIPNNDDAGRDGRALINETRPLPKERFVRMQRFKDYFICVGDFDFPIIPGDFIEYESNDKNIVQFDLPSYLITIFNTKSNRYTVRESDEPTIELKDRNSGFYIKRPRFTEISFQIVYSGEKPRYNWLKPLITEKLQDYPNFMKFAHLKNIQVNYINFNNTKKIENLIKNYDKNGFEFVVLTYSNINDNIKKFKKKLIENDIPNQTITKKTLSSGNYEPFTNSIFYQIINKIGCQTWGLKTIKTQIENIIGISIKHTRQKKISSILMFGMNGHFEEGSFINENDESFLIEFSNKIKRLTKEHNKFLILINGLLSNDQYDSLINCLNGKRYSIFEVFSTSLIRLFKTNPDGDVINRPISAGYGLYADDFLNLIAYEYSRGTQVCIKIREKFSNNIDTNNLPELIFNLTQFNPAYFRNSTKLPYPIHSSASSLKKGIQYNLDSFDFQVPFYL